MGRFRQHSWWNTTELRLLAQLYPMATWDEIEAALPRHTRGSIARKVQDLHLRRVKRPPRRDRGISKRRGT